MPELTVETIERMLQEQLSRDGCPPDFPALPEVPTARYCDPGFADLEMEHLWRKTWLIAGLASELSGPGAFRLFERCGRSAIIIRGRDDRIRAFHNSCRHRGSAVVAEPEGKAARFVCPYHGWTYGSEGQLLAVPEPQDFPCLDKSAKGLVPVRCETWRGLIFINFDPDAGPVEDYLAPLAGQAASFPFERFTVKCRHVVKLDCNWKMGIDNTLETYHVNQLHPQTIAPFIDVPSFTVGLLGQGHSRFVARKKSTTIMAPEQEVENVAGTMFEDYNICLKAFPNNFYLFDATGFVYHAYWPDGPGRCVVEFVQCGPESADVEYYEQLFSVMEPVLQEDWQLFPRMQRSLETGASPTMRLGYQERALYWMQEEIDRRIGPERVPEELRVPQVLTGM